MGHRFYKNDNKNLEKWDVYVGIKNPKYNHLLDEMVKSVKIDVNSYTNLETKPFELKTTDKCFKDAKKKF